MKAESPQPPELTLPSGRVALGAEAGRGATAVVFRATRVADGSPVALKVGTGAGSRAQLAAEAETLAFVDLDGVPRVLDAGLLPASSGELRGRPFLALEWVDGTTVVPAKIETAARERTAWAVARDVGRVLAALHGAGLSHGDVKPGNVLARPEPSFALVDLGLSEPASSAVPRGGTLRYLAPECFSGTASASDGRARDLWALGAMLAEIASEEVARASDLGGALPRAPLPAALGRLVRALTATVPGARPSADWVSRTARRMLGERGPESDEERRRARSIRAAYLHVRRGDLLQIARGRKVSIRVAGIAGQWMEQAADVLRSVAELREATSSALPVSLVDLDAFGRLRWITALVGASASRWPVPREASDSVLAERMLERARHFDPKSLSLPDLLGADAASAPLSFAEEPTELALALAGAAPSPAVLESTETFLAGHDAPALGLALAAALRRRGEIGRALSALAGLGAPRASLEAAECWRRAGDREAAAASLDAPGVRDLCVADARCRARAAAIGARIALDRGRPEEALAEIARAPVAPSTLEVRALAAIAVGRMEEAASAVAQGRALADSDEERARMAAVAGNLLHAAGESQRSLDAFVEASEHASRAGAVLEEATYLTGVAAAGLDAGHLTRSLDAANRAALLFDHLGRAPDAARAVLARAAVFAAARALPAAVEAAEDAERRARAAGDSRCRAFAHLVLADVLPEEDRNGVEHARRAAVLLTDAPDDDRLRAAARLLARGEEVPLSDFDQIAEHATTLVAARLDWWGARAERLVRASDPPERADRVLAALGALAAGRGPVPSRGEAFASAARLAGRIGDGEMSRRLATASAEAGRRLVETAPPELRTSVLSVPWLSALRPPRETGIVPEQLADIEALVRSLGAGTRGGLRPLLDQVLDALVLWTGVERGLLLLRAPGGRLVPRAARNIARKDLSGTQLELSHSLAERALATAEPVVAVDASGELPEVHESVHALKLRSVLALPLVARGGAVGVVYLDDRVRRGAFGPSELAWVRLVAALAAVAIADARGELELRRAARRARRASDRLARALSTREAELALATSELSRERAGRATRFPYDDIAGESEPMQRLFAILDRVTPTEAPVLVTGESGSGKELVARAIHAYGPRKDGPFVSENCSAVPEGLFESVLFGHVRGAFTGASRPHAGWFAIASGGTLFLDEIGEMGLGMQSKLLRVLEDGEVRPVGSERARKVDVRIIAATNRDLSKMVEAGTFRSDLFYRLDVIRVDVPPLRARPGDVEIMARHFLRKHAPERTVKISRQATDLLSAFSWPGNVRQLENEVRRALVLSDDVIRAEHLSAEVRDAGRAEAANDRGLHLRSRIDGLETELVTLALERTSGNQTRAAELLGVSRFGLQKMIRRLGVRPPAGPALRDDPGAVTRQR